VTAWETPVLKALAETPMSAAELTQVVLGELPQPKWVAFQAALQGMARRGVIVRTGTAVRGASAFKYALKEK
jgi:hypothetical protein